MLAALGTTRNLVAAGLTATATGQVEAERDVTNLGTSCADPFSSLRTHFWNSTNVTTGLIFTIQNSLQQLSASATNVLTSVFYRNSFHLLRHIFPSMTSTIIIIGPAVDQLRLPLHPKFYFLVLRGGYTGSKGLAPRYKIKKKWGCSGSKNSKMGKSPWLNSKLVILGPKGIFKKRFQSAV